MKYLVANFNIQSVGDSDQQTICDLLCATLGEVGFESFAETENGIDAYIQEELFDKNTFKQLRNDHSRSFVVASNKCQLCIYANVHLWM